MGDIGQPLRKIEVLPIETPLLPTNPTMTELPAHRIPGPPALTPQDAGRPPCRSRDR